MHSRGCSGLAVRVAEITKVRLRKHTCWSEFNRGHAFNQVASTIGTESISLRPTIFGSSPPGRFDMQIAQVAPLTEAVPPKFYGGTQRVVFFFSDPLVETGPEVPVFSPARHPPKP